MDFNDDLNLLLLTLALSIFLAIHYYRKNLNLKKEKMDLLYKLETQSKNLNKLKQENLRFQLSPHSFKNALGSIKYFTHMADKSIDYLSDVLDYMLYETNVELVSIEQELTFLRDYVELNKLRINNVNAIRINKNIEYNNSLAFKQILPPLITVGFVENAFKHGDLEHDNALLINFDLIGNELNYQVQNKFKRQGAKSIYGGIGQKNLKERLDILFPNCYILDFKIDNDYYISTLKLILK